MAWVACLSASTSAGRLDGAALPDQIARIDKGGPVELAPKSVDVADGAEHAAIPAEPAGFQTDSSPTTTQLLDRIRDVDGNLPDVLGDVGLGQQPDVVQVGVPLCHAAEEIGNVTMTGSFSRGRR